jgi:peptidoglycan-associated lipoprotein
MLRVLLLSILLVSLSCNTTSKLQKANVTETKYDNSLAVIQWDLQTIDLGKVKLGETRNLEYTFTNIGQKALEIELVTSCKCTQLEWPVIPIRPGEKGTITVTYDSTGQKLGQLKKTLDVIANTDPIVVEAFFTVEVVE